MEFIKKLSIFLYEILIDLIYPPNCVICGKESLEKYLCKDCRAIFEQELYYRIENKKNKYFEKNIYCFKYKGKIRKTLIDYKFNDKAYLVELFVKFLLKNEKICRFFKSYDIITAVPIYKKRKKLRGYNQSKLIAKKISKEYKNLIYEDLLKKKIDNKKQSSLNKLERIENVKNVYNSINLDKIKNKNIIIIDDIYTTGATLNECSKVLRKNGANSIIVITIAKD